MAHGNLEEKEKEKEIMALGELPNSKWKMT